MKGELTRAEQRANELYPNSKTFCGGVASIAREAYLQGCRDTKEQIRSEISAREQHYCDEIRRKKDDKCITRIMGMQDECLDLLVYIDNSLI